jgi:hypothetical protein
MSGARHRQYFLRQWRAVEQCAQINADLEAPQGKVTSAIVPK